MMAEPAANLPTDAGEVGDEIACSKCGATNPKNGRRCAECDAHLYVRCYHCRERNVRGARTCAACGKSMHTPLLRRLRRGLDGDNARLILMVSGVILFLIFAVLGANYLTSPQRQYDAVTPPVISPSVFSNTPPLQAAAPVPAANK